MILGDPDFSVQPLGAAPGPESLFCCFQNGRVLLAGEGEAASPPTWAQVQALLPKGFVPFELAHTGDIAIFSPHPFLPFEMAESEGMRFHELRVFRCLPYAVGGRIASCWHLWSWYQRNRYCGCCGGALAPAPDERALRCERCGQTLYPAIAPAVIVAITDGDRILLARNARSSFRHYALISGYVEVGETLEHAVRREVKEEVGLSLRSLRYLGNQPWGVSGSQMFAFHAEATGGESIVLQRSELADARWFSRSELEPRAHTASIAFELIERFRTGRL